MENSKVGDIVRVHDGSYSIEFNEVGKMKGSYGSAMKDRDMEVIAVGCDLPAESSYLSKHERNHIILRALDDYSIYFIQERMFKLAHRCHEHKCPSCGKQI